MRVDFIAGHQLQARAGESVFEALKDRADCRWRIGRGIEPDGAAAVVLMDHTHQNPAFATKEAWRNRFYLMHDLGDVLAYRQERKVLRNFSMVIVPDHLHARHARRHLWWWTKVRIGGWPKYDVTAAVLKLPDRPTILYAPTWAGKAEWRELLPAFAKLPVNVLIKNHTYATAPGEPVSEFYRISRQEVAAMEQTGQTFSPAMTVVPPELNICAVFPHVDVVISDQSSVAAEFLPWGLAIETGANPDGDSEPGISRWYPGVEYRPIASLVESLESGGQHFLQEVTQSRQKTGPEKGAGKKIADMIWKELCT